MDYPGFCGPSTRARALDVSAARTVNLYSALHQDPGAPPRLTLTGIPGLRRRWQAPEGPVRGLYTTSTGRCFAVIGRTLFEVFASGPLVARGTLQSPRGRVGVTDNGLMLALVDGSQGYGLTLETNVFSATRDPDFRGGTRISFLDGRFVWNIPGTGQYQWSALYSPSIDGLAFATAEARPDPLVSLLTAQRELWLFGTQTTEVLYSTGDPFTPFQRLPGALQEVGSVGPWVAQALGNTVIWVTQNTQGQGLVVAAQQYQPQRISTPAIEWALSQSTRLADAVGMAYSQEGHSWYGLYVPDLETSYWYDATTEQWSERGTLWANSLQMVGGDDPRWYPWRPYVHTFAHGQHLVGSWEEGTLYTLDPTCYTDDERELVRMRVAPTLRQEQEWFQIARLRVHLETGVGLDGGVVPGSDPQVMLRLSRDGGHTWDSARWATAGRHGQYGQVVEFRRLGRARQLTAEVSISDPVPVTVLGATLN